MLQSQPVEPRLCLLTAGAAGKGQLLVDRGGRFPLRLIIAWLRLRQDRLPDAYKAQRRAIEKQPNELRQYKMLDDILERMGRTQEARSVLAHVSRMQAAAAPPSAL